MKMFITAAMAKKMPTIGDLFRKKAPITRLASMRYLRKGKILLPAQPRKYLYPSYSSNLLQNNDRRQASEIRIMKIYATELMLGVMNLEIS